MRYFFIYLLLTSPAFYTYTEAKLAKYGSSKNLFFLVPDVLKRISRGAGRCPDSQDYYYDESSNHYFCRLQDCYYDEYRGCQPCCYMRDDRIDSGAPTQGECKLKHNPCDRNAMWGVCGGPNKYDPPEEPNYKHCTGTVEPTLNITTPGTGTPFLAEPTVNITTPGTGTPFLAEPTLNITTPGTGTSTTPTANYNVTEKQNTSITWPVTPVRNTTTKPTTTKQPRKKRKAWIPGVVVVAAFVFFIAFGSIIFCIVKKPGKKQDRCEYRSMPMDEVEPSSPRGSPDQQPDLENGVQRSSQSNRGGFIHRMLSIFPCLRQYSCPETVRRFGSDRSTDSGIATMNNSPRCSAVELEDHLTSICAALQNAIFQRLYNQNKDHCDSVRSWTRVFKEEGVDEELLDARLSSVSESDLHVSSPDSIRNMFAGPQTDDQQDKLVTSLKFLKDFKPMHPPEDDMFPTMVDKVSVIFSSISTEDCDETGQSSVTSMLTDTQCQDITEFVRLVEGHPDLPKEDSLQEHLDKVKDALKKRDSNTLKMQGIKLQDLESKIRDNQRRIKNQERVFRDEQAKNEQRFNTFEESLTALKYCMQLQNRSQEYPEDPALTLKCKTVLEVTDVKCKHTFRDVTSNLDVITPIIPYCDTYEEGRQLCQALARVMGEECIQKHKHIEYYRSDSYSVIQNLLDLKAHWPISVLFVCLHHFKMQEVIDILSAMHKDCKTCRPYYSSLQGNS